MNKKCFNIINLQKYENKSFIYERKSINEESIYNYKTILQKATMCVEFLEKYQVTNHVGIAVDMKEHSATTCILLLGILNHQCHFYCLDFQESQDVEAYLRSSGVKYLFSPQNLMLDIISSCTRSVLKILNDVFFLYILKTQDSEWKMANFCYTIATSGSTGLPKVVHVPYECIEHNIKALSHLLKININDMIFLGSPATFDPFIVEFFIALENGACILITSKEIRLQPQQLAKIMFPEKASKRAVTLYQTTPSLFRLFGRDLIRDVILSTNSALRCLLLGGEDFPTSLEVKSWLPLEFHLTGKRIFNIYGITEVSCWSSIYEFNANTLSFGEDRVPLGKPLDNLTSFRLVDEFGTVLSHNNCKGELEIGSSIRRTFIPQYDTNVKNLKSKQFIYRKTGDLVERDRNGNIYYIGRMNNTIKRLGTRLCLDSLNKKIEKLLSANNMCDKAISLFHKELLYFIFYSEESEKAPSDKKESVVKILKENLEKHEQPDQIFYNSALPLNRHGKVDRNKILQQLLLPTNSPVGIFKDFLRNVIGFQLDEDKSQSIALATCSKRVKLSKNLSFSEAGGTSFQALSLATEIAQHLGEYIEQRKILEMLLDGNITIEDIIQFLMTCSRKSEILKPAYERFENISGNKNYELKMLWRYDLKKCIDAAPSVYEGKFVAVGSHSHLVVTVNTTTGEEISCLKFEDRIECPVVFVTPQLALVGCYDGFLYGFDFNKGTILWKLNANGMIKAKPLIMGNVIIIGSYAEDYNILAYDLKSLALVWRLKLGSKGVFSSPVQITAKSVLVCGLDGTYALIEAATGSIKWCQKLETPIFSTATKMQAAGETILFIAEVKGKISICEAESGEKITAFQTEGNIFSGLTLHHPDNTNYSFVIFGCHDKNVYCLKLEHSNKQLVLFSKISLNSAVYSTPIVISNSCILACSTKGLIVLLSIYDSTILASYDLKAEIFSSPCCLSDKYFYVGSRNNHLYAFELEV